MSNHLEHIAAEAIYQMSTDPTPFASMPDRGYFRERDTNRESTRGHVARTDDGAHH